MGEHSKDGICYHHYSFTFDSEQVGQRIADVRVVLIAGSGARALAQAEYLAERLETGAKRNQESQLYELEQLTKQTSRFVLYKVGPVLVGDHGMGGASLTITLHELFLMCKEANILNKIALIRFGTCGGIGVPPGSLCITNRAVDPLFRDYVELKICLRLVRRDCVMDQQTAAILVKLAREGQQQDSQLDQYDIGKFQVHSGATIATNDFYEEQARMTGAICEHSQEDRQNFLDKAKSEGVINAEMESNYLAAMCHKLGVSFGVVCVTLVDRLKDDKIIYTSEQMAQYQRRLFWLNLMFIRHKLGSSK